MFESAQPVDQDRGLGKFRPLRIVDHASEPYASCPLPAGASIQDPNQLRSTRLPRYGVAFGQNIRTHFPAPE